jgi:hypothetical protein
MIIKIRDWDTHFEADRSRQWKKLSWVPIPNKQGLGYKKIMQQKNGAEIFGCWNALIQQASLCTPRGDLTKYSIDDLSTNTMIPLSTLKNAIAFIVEHLDWIEVIKNLDINVNERQQTGQQPAVVSSILCSSILCSSSFELEVNTFTEYHEELRKKFISYWTEPNKSKTKMRFQLEKTWDTKRRLETWASRDFNKQLKKYGPQDFTKTDFQIQQSMKLI